MASSHDHDHTYLQLLKTILLEGVNKPAARENMPGSLSLFGYQAKYNMRDGFPLLTTKKMHFKGIVAELLWFLRGDTNIKYLIDKGTNIWNEDAYNYYVTNYKLAKEDLTKEELEQPVRLEDEPLSFEAFISAVKDNTPAPKALDFYGYRYGDCGFQYGKVWRAWEKTDDSGVTSYVDQVLNVLYSLYHTPESRRHVITATDPAHDQDLALYWCHSMFQFNTFIDKNGQRNIDVNLTQRSCDSFLDGPYNLASYSLMLHIFGNILNYKPNTFIHSFGDAHIYDNHHEAVAEQLKRDPYTPPTLQFSRSAQAIFSEIKRRLSLKSLESVSLTSLISQLKVEDFILVGYQSHPAIKAELSTGMKK
jgi:thymidylate synthase